MSSDLKVENFDSEHMIIRLPEHIAESLNKDLIDGVKLEKKLSIKFNKDSRECNIRYNDTKLNGIIVNLPNEACTMKTTNNETFTNLLPIKHMILADGNLKTKYNKDYTLRDGVAPPLKNINILKYRKPKKKQSFKMMKMIKEMLMADSKADSVWYKMIDESDDEETEVRDMEYIRAESERIELEKRKAKEVKDHLNAIENSSDDQEGGQNSSDSSSNSSSDDSDLSLTEDEFEEDLSTDDDDFEDY